MKCMNKCEGNMDVERAFIRGSQGGKLIVSITYTCLNCQRVIRWMKDEPGMSVLSRGNY